MHDSFLTFDQLQFGNSAAETLYLRAAGLAAPKPIQFQLDGDLRQRAAAREFTDFWLVWIRVQRPEKIAHELAHIILELEEHTPVLDPLLPTDPGTREALGNVIGLLDHPQVHQIMRDVGLDDQMESEEALNDYFAEAQTVDFLGSARVHGTDAHPLMAIGFANMDLTHGNSNRARVEEIRAVLARRSPETLGVSERIVNLVQAQRGKTALDVLARRVCDVVGIRGALRNCIWPWDRKQVIPFSR
jgi:hypothetical protein